MSKIVEVNVQSEIGKLNGVILHTPGEEVENMTPENAERALYSDILNLSIAKKEYKQLSEVLGKITQTYQVRSLLTNILKEDKIKQEVLDRIEKIEPFIAERTPKGSIKERLLEENAEDLARLLIEGVEMTRDTLTKFLNKDWYAALMFTTIGKIVLAICGLAIVITAILMFKFTKQVEYRK